ncbi:VOC family protein [Pseudonocardia sp.]|uniref:VOC family protein n=1 Tax=Pseudonocardia sp. TaxID=60912 RepID=UPI003D10BC89
MADIIRITPKLVVGDGAAALAFYTEALGATVEESYTVDGRIVHATLTVGVLRFELKDAGDGDPAPVADRHPPVLMSLAVTDADAVTDRLLAAGATVVYPVADQEYGARGGRVADPFGHHWMVSTPIESLGPDEVQARLDALP